jgi:Mg-chelatase subunit ChlD
VFEPVPVAPLAEGEEELRRTIGDLISGGSSSLYDGVRRGFETIRALDDGSRINAVIVVADGADDGSSATLDELAEELAGACDVEGAVIPVITVAYGPEADREALARIAGTCQGRALTASPDDEAEDDVVDVFRRIALLF